MAENPLLRLLSAGLASIRAVGAGKASAPSNPGISQVQLEAVEKYRKAAERGDAAAQYMLGDAHAKGQGVARDHAKAVEWWRKAAEQGNADAQWSLGVAYDNGWEEVAQDHAKAVALYRMAAEQGNVRAQWSLGYMYREGRGVAQDHARAVEWWRKAADQGDAAAQYGLGVAYVNGQGVAMDEIEAVEWWRKAAEQGNASAQRDLGSAYAYGRGVPVNRKKAMLLWFDAAEGGDEAAQCILGVAFDTGVGAPLDHSKAVMFYRMAAERGNAEAQYNLGFSYHSGRGAVQDDAMAVEWWRRAAEQGDAKAREALQHPRLVNQARHRETNAGEREKAMVNVGTSQYPSYSGAELHNMKRALDQMLAERLRAGLLEEAKEIHTRRGELIAWIESKNPAYKHARETYILQTEVIDRMMIGQCFEGPFQDPPMYDRFGARDSSPFLDAIRVMKGELYIRTGSPFGSELAEFMTTKDFSVLEDVRRGLASEIREMEQTSLSLGREADGLAYLKMQLEDFETILTESWLFAYEMRNWLVPEGDSESNPGHGPIDFNEWQVWKRMEFERASSIWTNHQDGPPAALRVNEAAS